MPDLDEKITQLPVATVLSGSEVAPVVQGGVTKQAAISLFRGGSYLSENTARVDPGGNDATGTVEDLSKPFLTAQAAVTALENFGGPFSASFPAVLLLPFKDTVEDVTTSLQYLSIIGTGGSGGANPAIGSITLTNDGTGAPDTGAYLILNSVYVGNVSAPNLDILSGTPLTIKLTVAVVSGDITTSAAIVIESISNTGSVSANIIPGSGQFVSVHGLRPSVADQNYAVINAPGSDVTLVDSFVSEITAAGTISMQESVVAINNSGVTPTRMDYFLNPANLDFSTLPTTQPTTVGSAWIDTAGGLNIIKVKL